MRKIDLFYPVGAIGVCIVDLFTKLWACWLTVPKMGGILNIFVQVNRGIIFGALSGLSSRTMIEALGSGLVILLFLVLRFHTLLPLHVPGVRSALALITGGVLSNVADRFMHGYVVDFIFLKIGNLVSPIFNLADVSLCLGIVIFVWVFTGDDGESESSEQRSAT